MICSLDNFIYDENEKLQLNYLLSIFLSDTLACQASRGHPRRGGDEPVRATARGA